jgi:hypothetical protein
LRDKLALCVAQEAQGGSAHGGLDGIEGRWAALPTLPSPWENALVNRRVSIASHGANGAGGSADEALLNLEIALELPSPAEHEVARRDSRLRALKASMEGRPSAAEPMGDVESLIAQVLGMVGLKEPQQRRLSAVIGALRAGVPRTG